MGQILMGIQSEVTRSYEGHALSWSHVYRICIEDAGFEASMFTSS